jgi:hypothetical protein
MKGLPQMTILEKLLATALVGAIFLTLCVAASLTEIHGSVTYTIAFGKQPAPKPIDPRIAALAAAIPESALWSK